MRPGVRESFRPAAYLVLGLLVAYASLGRTVAQEVEEYEPQIVFEPEVGAAADGSFVIVWDDLDHVYAQRYLPAGQPAGEVIVVEEGVPAPNPEPFSVFGHAVSMDSAGSFVVAWASMGEFLAAHFRLFDKEGQTVAFKTLGDKLRPKVSMLPAGGFVLAYLDIGKGIMVQAVDALGQLQGEPFGVTRVNDDQGAFDLATDAAGRVLVAYEESSGRNELVLLGYDQKTRVLEATTGYLDPAKPMVAAGPEGMVATVWQEGANFFKDGAWVKNKSVMLSVVDGSGKFLRDSMLVNSVSLSRDPGTDVWFDPNGNIVVAYAAQREGLPQILSVRYRVSGGKFEEPLVPEDSLWVNRDVSGEAASKRPSIAGTPDGKYVVVWETFRSAPDGTLLPPEIHFRWYTGEGDRDFDGVPDAADKCPDRYDPSQVDQDGDGTPNACDDDADGDGLPNASDNCPLVQNADQADRDTDGLGDLCDDCPDASHAGLVGAPGDRDRDGIGDHCDRCPIDADNDPDQDVYCSYMDNCPRVPNPNQEDADNDFVGDACDNCPGARNPNQADADQDGVGDACEPFIRGDSNRDEKVDVSDAIFSLSYLFLGGPGLCSDAMDANDDGGLNITDAIYALTALFLGGPAIPYPYPESGVDPTHDELGCEDLTKSP